MEDMSIYKRLNNYERFRMTDSTLTSHRTSSFSIQPILSSSHRFNISAVYSDQTNDVDTLTEFENLVVKRNLA